MKTTSQITKVIFCIFFFLSFLFSNPALGQSSPYNISGYCNSINQVGSITTYTDRLIYVAVQSTRAYLTAFSLGLRVVDISTPSHPVEIGHYLTPDSTQFLNVNGNYAYLGQQGSMFRIIDISNPTNMREVGNFTTSSYIYNMAINNGYAFFDHYNAGLEIVDIHNFSDMSDVVINTTSFNQDRVATESTFMYIITVDGTFEVFDISSFSNITEIGFCSVSGYGYSVYLADIYLGKKYAYVIGTGGITIIDRSNPYQPVVVGTYNDVDNVGQVVENGDFIYFGDDNGIQVVDIQDPSNPVEVAYYDTPSGAYGLAGHNNYIYAAEQYSGFYVFNADNPLGNVTVSVTGDTTLTTNTDSTGYYEIYGLSYGNYTVTPTVTSYQFFPTQQVYSGLMSNQTNQDYYGTLNINVTINSVPNGILISAYNTTTTTPFSFVVNGGTGFTISANSPTISIDSVTQFAFTAWSDGGAQSHTVYPTTSTTFTVSYDTQYYVTTQYTPNNGGEVRPYNGWFTNGTLLSCTAFPNSGFQFVNWTGDLSGSGNPTTLLIDGPKTLVANFTLATSGSFKIGGYCVRPDYSGDYYEVGNSPSQDESYFVKVNGNLAFLADGTAGLHIIDVSNSSSPKTIGNFTTTGDGVYGVDVRASYAYVAGGTTGLHVLDISNPLYPLEVGSFDSAGSAVGIVIQGNYAYIAFDSGGLWIVDISNPANPIGVSNIPAPTSGVGSLGYQYSYTIQAVVSNKYLYIAEWNYGEYLDWDGYWGYIGYPFANNIIFIVDIQNPINPQIVGSYSYGGIWYLNVSLSGVATQGNYAYLTDYGGSLTVLDISNPTNPVEISATTVPGNPEGIDVRGDFAYIAAWNFGLQVANIANPYNSYDMGSYQTPAIAQNVEVNGNYAFVADDTSGLQIIHVAYPISNTFMTLSGNTQQFTYTDSSGYYEFDNLPFGNYTVVPYNNLFSSFSPSTNTYAGLNYNQLNGDFVGTYSAWTNTNGEFANASDTENWAYQNSPNVTSEPNINWLPTYQGHTGVMQLSFSSQSQGLKMTSFARFTPDTTNPWYRVRVNYYCDSPFNGNIIPVILMYQDDESETIEELGASYTGNSLIQSGTWYTIDDYLYCETSSGQVQVILTNNGSQGNMYIDSIDLENVTPPGFSNSTYVSVPWGGFEMSTETSYWGLQTAPGTTNGQPTLGWESSMMTFAFTTSSQGQKMTSRNTFYIPPNSNAIMAFNIYSDSPTPTQLSVLGCLFAEKDVNAYIWDESAVGDFGILSGDTWNTVYVPLTSVSEQTSYRLQLFIRNQDQYPENIYLDDIELFYGENSPDSQPVIVLGSKPRELLE